MVNSRLLTLLAFGVPLMGSYLPSATARTPDDDPSTNSIGGGRRLLNASISLDGLSCAGSSDRSWVENGGVGSKGDTNMLYPPERNAWRQL